MVLMVRNRLGAMFVSFEGVLAVKVQCVCGVAVDHSIHVIN